MWGSSYESFFSSDGTQFLLIPSLLRASFVSIQRTVNNVCMGTHGKVEENTWLILCFFRLRWFKCCKDKRNKDVYQKMQIVKKNLFGGETVKLWPESLQRFENPNNIHHCSRSDDKTITTRDLHSTTVFTACSPRVSLTGKLPLRPCKWMQT